MANSTLNTVEQVEGITLTLSKREVVALLSVLFSVGGEPNYTERGTIDGIMTELQGQVEIQPNDLWKSPSIKEGSIYFNDSYSEENIEEAFD